MANTDVARGLVPIRHTNGSPWNNQVESYLVPAADGTAVGVGDVVKLSGTSGAAGVYVNGVNCEGMPTVIRQAATNTGADIVGVVVGFSPNQADLTIKHRAASTNRIAYVASAFDTVFEIQEDADTTPVAAASVGLNASLVLGSVDTTTGLANVELDSSSVATTNTLPLKILRLVNRPGNALNTAGAGSDNAKFEVMFNTHAINTDTAGV